MTKDEKIAYILAQIEDQSKLLFIIKTIINNNIINSSEEQLDQLISTLTSGN